jgi:hypothetical protein
MIRQVIFWGIVLASIATVATFARLQQAAQRHSNYSTPALIEQ